MSTQTYYFTGKCKWAHLAQPDEFRGQRKYKINIYLDKKGLRELNESGARLEVQEDAEGKYVRFSRPESKTIKEETVVLGAPWVCHGPEGEEVDFEKPETIGNGSIVNCKVSVYDTQMGKGHTLEAVKVLELVEYTGEKEPTERKF